MAAERIEKNLYKRQYQNANGEWSTLYYAAFVCRLKGKRRTFPLGADLKTARKELAVLIADDIRKKDFDADKEKQKAGLTFADYGAAYFNGKVDPDKRAGGVEREKRSFKTLKSFFGGMLLSEIDRSKVMEYRAKRSAGAHCLKRQASGRDKDKFSHRESPFFATC